MHNTFVDLRYAWTCLVLWIELLSITRINETLLSYGSPFRFVSISSINRWNFITLTVISAVMIPYIFLFDKASTKLQLRLSEKDFTNPFHFLEAQPPNLQFFELNLNSSMNIISIPFYSRFTYSHANSNNFLIISCQSVDIGLDSNLWYNMFNRFYIHRDMVVINTYLISLNDF